MGGEEIMNRVLLKAALAATTALTVLAPELALAAADDDTIVVTARRVEENLQDVSISITVVDQEELTKRNIVSAAELGNFVPSLSTNEQFGPGKASFVIRGFTQEGKTSPSVAVYFADVVAPRSFGGTTSGNGAGIGSMFDLENVQVLKGPQGTLFGRNTTGGAILLVPTKPRDRVEGYVQGSVGTHDMVRVEAVLNAPLGERVRFRAGVDWHKRDGFVRNRSGVGPKDFNDIQYVAARLSLVVDLADNLENYTIASYAKSDTNGNVNAVRACTDAAGNPPDPAQIYTAFVFNQVFGVACGQIARQQARGDGFRDVENDEPNPYQKIRQWQVINTTTWEASDNLTIKNIISYAEFKEAVSFSLFGTNFLLPGTNTLLTRTINLHPGFSGWQSQQSTFTEELQFIGEAAGGRLRWQAGGYFELSKPLGWNAGNTEIFTTCANGTDFVTGRGFETCRPFNLPIFLPGGGVFFQPIGSISSSNVKTTFNNKAIYAQASYDITDQFTITGGIRYTIDKMKDVSENMNIFTAPDGTVTFRCQNQIVFMNAIVTDQSQCNIPLRDKWKKPTWLINLDYKPSDDLLLYAKWARGYRQGSINSNNLGLEVVGPERVDTFEVGAKKTLTGPVSGFVNFAAHYSEFRDQQLAVNTVVAPAFQGRVSPSQPIVNAGRSRIWGIELDAGLRLFEGFRIDGGYAYLNTKLLEITPPPVPIFFAQILPASVEGGPLPLAPKHRLTLSATYTLPLDESIGRVSLGASYSYTAANNAVSPNASQNFFRLESSNLVNLNLDWEDVGGMPMDIAFFVTNVLNEKRFTYPAGSFSTVGNEGGHLNVPRMFGMRVKLKIGD
jgi:iron complex outermembrane recepter protein